MKMMHTFFRMKTATSRLGLCMASSLMTQHKFLLDRLTDEIETRNVMGQSLVQIGTIKVAPLENEIKELDAPGTNTNSNLDNSADDNEIKEVGNGDSRENKPESRPSNRGSDSNEIKEVGSLVENVSSNKRDSVNTSALDIEELEKKLEHAAQESHKLRFRLMMTTTGVGVPLTVVFAILFYSVSSWFAYGMFLSVPLILLGIMPSDKIAVRVVSTVFMVLLGVVGILATWGSYQDWFVRRHIDTGYDGNGVSEEYCGSDLPEAGCLVQALPLQGVFFIAISLILSRNVFIAPDTRTALERLWFCGRLFYCINGMINICRGLFYRCFDDHAPFFDNDDFEYCMTTSTLCILCAFLYTETNRHRIMSFLNSLHAKGEAQSASSVAALVGKTDPKKVLQLAKKKFRQINFSKLEKDDFASNRDKKGETNKLFQHTEEVQLGCCDAFMSHSWSDDGPEKYLTLKNWAEEFKTKKGRYPNIWLDKACIDQTDIESDLLCLPIFLAGCKELVIIPGETYTSRLWCIIEIFTFLKIGGSKDRITVLPIKMTEEKAKAMFEKVDASKCKCWVEEDRQRLLGIIEEGFGGFGDFNSIVRHVFKERLDVSSHSRNFNSLTSFGSQKAKQKSKYIAKGKVEGSEGSTKVAPIE